MFKEHLILLYFKEMLPHMVSPGKCSTVRYLGRKEKNSYESRNVNKIPFRSVADPGFTIGGCGPCRRGCGLLRWLHFEIFVCQNERIGTLRGAHTGCAP